MAIYILPWVTHPIAIEHSILTIRIPQRLLLLSDKSTVIVNVYIESFYTLPHIINLTELLQPTYAMLYTKFENYDV